jgi:uncharacterized protein
VQDEYDRITHLNSRTGAPPVLRSTIATLLLLPLGACATLQNTARSYLVASNGLQIDDERTRQLLIAGRADSALRAVSNRKSVLSPDDRLLRVLYQGTAARYAGKYREAGRFFDDAYQLTEDRFTKSASQTALALVTNDRALSWTPGQSERLLINLNALLAYSDARDVDASVVEARRLSALLARFGDPQDGERQARASLHLVAAAAFRAAGDEQDALVSFRNAARIGAAVDSSAPAANDSVGDVYVVVERGFAPHKVAVGLTLPVWSSASTVAASSSERMLGNFANLRNGGVWWDDVPSWRFNDQRYWGRPMAAAYMLDLSWPVLRRARQVRGTLQVRSAGTTVSGSSLGEMDISELLAGDYRRDRGAILTRTIARGVAKYATSRAVEEAAEALARKDKDKDKDKDDSGARAVGTVARVLTNIATSAIERADTRMWSLLPGSVSVIRLRLPAGVHELMVDAGGASQLTLPGVRVRAGQSVLLSARLWNETSNPWSETSTIIAGTPAR